MADLRGYCGVQETQLTIGAAAAATSITLDNLVDIYNNTLTMTDFGTKGFARINPDGDNIAEDISFTGVTANGDGTFTLTGVKTVLAKAPYTETSGLVRSHGTGSPVRFSNVPGFYGEFANKNNDETINETWTYSNTDIPRLDSYVAPTDDEEFATKKYVDDTAGGTPVSQNRIVVTATAGATVADGQVVYLDETDNEWKLADASASATCDNVQLGIAQGAGTDGNPITGGVLLVGRDNGQSGLTQGDRLYVSDTAGAISNSPGTVEVEIGHAVSATEIDFSPKFASYTTKLQRNALAGTSGTPDTGNEYVTANDQTRNLSQVQYATSTTGNDTYVVTLSPAPTAYTAGMEVVFKPDTANTGACTLNVNSLGAKAIKVNVSDDPQNNAIKANSLVVVRYDGTNFQLISNDEVLLGGTSSDADARHTHGELELMPGIKNATRSKTYWNFPILFTDDTSTTGTWNITGYTANGAGSWFSGDAGAGARSAITVSNVWLSPDGSTPAGILFGDGKDIFLEFALAAKSTGTNAMGWGLMDDTTPLTTYNSTVASVNFCVDASGNLYAHTADGTTSTETAISGITLTNVNTYRIEFEAGVEARFYVNGTLEATVTTTLPAGTNSNFDVRFAFGGGITNFPDYIGAPYFAIEK